MIMRTRCKGLSLFLNLLPRKNLVGQIMDPVGADGTNNKLKKLRKWIV